MPRTNIDLNDKILKDALRLTRIKTKKEEEMCITEIILTEILQGIKEDTAYETTKSYLLEFPIIKPKGNETYISAADIYRKCRKQGKTIRKTIDCIIAAIAQENNLTILHNDNDFEVIKKCSGLKTIKVNYKNKKLVPGFASEDFKKKKKN